MKRVFIWQGSYIALFGGGVGLILAVLLVLGQQKFGWIQIENSIVSAYPMEIVLKDVLLTFVTVSVLGYLISLYPAKKAAKTEIKQLN